MRSRYLLLLMILMVSFSCKKDRNETSNPPPDTPITPTSPVLLKDIVIPNLPSPFYAFEYNSAGQVIVSNYASGFIINDISYVDNRISEMKNRIDNRLLRYFYDDEGRTSLVMYIDPGGNVRKRVHLTYNGRQLIRLERERNQLTNFALEKRMTFSYYPDGNIKEITDHRLPMDGLPESITTDLYEEYDDKINVDNFMLLHNEFFDQVILLPGVSLQKNNYHKLTHTGDGLNYRINYVYTYNDSKLPIARDGVGVWLNGVDEGSTFVSNYAYTYY